MKTPLFITALLLAATLQADTLHVGQGQPFARPSDAAKVAKDGDTVFIHAGNYRGDVCAWRANNLTLQGEGADCVTLDADGAICMGKGLWVMVGKNATLSGITFRGARCPDRNGAGIRIEPSAADITIRGCTFRENENGILSGPGDGTTTIEYCTFVHNGAGDGASHNLYIGAISKLVFRHNLSDHANNGHNLKSRAHENLVEGCRFDDATDGHSSYLADFPNGGLVTVRDCYFRQAPTAENNRLVAYGQEGNLHPNSQFLFENNTLVNLRDRGASFVAVKGSTPTARNNTYEGKGENRL